MLPRESFSAAPLLAHDVYLELAGDVNYSKIKGARLMKTFEDLLGIILRRVGEELRFFLQVH